MEKARMARDAGLEVGVLRFGVTGVDHDRQIEQALACGAKIVALTTAPVFIRGRAMGQTTRAAFDAWLPEFAALGEKCRKAGLILAYHNHWWDHAPLGGEAPLDIMARTIAPGDLSFEIDCAWAWLGGVAPLDLVARLGPRVVSLHLKDIDRRLGAMPTQQTVPPGSGEMGYGVLIPRLDRLTRAVAYVEVDTSPDGMAAALAGARFVRHARGQAS
jgi:sugar phosphate isomerase/epimerase